MTGSAGGRPRKASADDVFDALTTGEPYTTTEAANATGEMSSQTAKRRLETLVEQGRVAKKTHGERLTTYWIPPLAAPEGDKQTTPE